MAEIGAQRTHVSQNSLRIIPAGFQRPHCEGVTKIVQPGTRARWVAVPEPSDNPDENHMGSGLGRSMTVTQHKEIVACAANLTSDGKVLLKGNPG
ncbi:hypothetical protein GCM10007857_70410 [Bradyrhizobium iriomotense]|uniref:Uncharacterized protein n=1 Tax=Bradyrhizobium iriomotense TaxID=441950 RepID=A0ABQ6B7D6_9BRAD|nr:hypothetical protein GCM10007857_70410 [Bradyrhizobium iriomotense]